MSTTVSAIHVGMAELALMVSIHIIALAHQDLLGLSARQVPPIFVFNFPFVHYILIKTSDSEPTSIQLSESTEPLVRYEQSIVKIPSFGSRRI